SGRHVTRCMLHLSLAIKGGRMAPTHSLITIGARLAWARTEAGLSCAQAALLLGITRDTIVYAEQDRIALSPTYLRQMAEVYDVRADWLVNGIEPETLPPFVGKIDVT